MAKTHRRHRRFNSGFSFQDLHHLDEITASLGWSSPHENTASRRNWSSVNYFRVSAPTEARKSSPMTDWWSPWNLSVSLLIAWNNSRRTEASGVKLSNVERNSVKPEKSAATELRKKLRKGITTTASVVITSCSHSPRLFCAQIGFISHLHTYGRLPQS